MGGLAFLGIHGRDDGFISIASQNLYAPEHNVRRYISFSSIELHGLSGMTTSGFGCTDGVCRSARARRKSSAFGQYFIKNFFPSSVSSGRFRESMSSSAAFHVSNARRIASSSRSSVGGVFLSSGALEDGVFSFGNRGQCTASGAPRILHSGEMAEWSKARDSKSRNPQKGFEGSNPSLSAIRLAPHLCEGAGLAHGRHASRSGHSSSKKTPTHLISRSSGNDSGSTPVLRSGSIHGSPSFP